MRLIDNIKWRLRFFAEDMRGSMAAESALIMPLLVWWYIASFQFFDAFRERNINLKAAYTIADMISREAQVDTAYLAGLNTVFDYLTSSNHPTRVRVTSLSYNEDTMKYDKHWSRVVGKSATLPEQTTATLNQAQNKARIPTMPNADFVILVETFMAYEPIFNIGVDARWYETFIVTRPRFSPCVGLSDGTVAEQSCSFGGNT